MSAKRKRTNIISSRKGIVEYVKEESVIYSLAKIKSHQLKNDCFIPFITNLFISKLPLAQFHSNEDITFNNNCHEINFVNLFNFFYESYLYTLLFPILLKYILITILNTIKTQEKNREEERIKEEKIGEYLLYWQARGITQNYSPESENELFGPSNVTTNTCKFTDDKKNKNDNIIFIIKQSNERKKFLKRNINHLRNFIKITKYIILLNLFNNIFVNNKVSLIEYNFYNITLKIKGIGTKKIFSSNDLYKSEYYPDEVYINGNKQNSVYHSYTLNETDNVIGLKWYNLAISCDCMFYGCSDITEIDCSNFTIFNVKVIRSMFNECTSLTSLNLSNFDTSKVIWMNNMFSDCSSLTSLDLSNFNTSEVINLHHLFRGCSLLTSLDLSNFDTSKVTTMFCMFKGCSSLTSLNLSNFDTSKVTNMFSMFEGCIKLEYINMFNFDENSLNISNIDTYSDIFKNVPKNIVLCINKANIINIIYNQISIIENHIEDCSDDWNLKQNIYIESNILFINNSSDIILYEYEYNSQFVSQSPNENFYDENNFSEFKCELEKCLTCPTEALRKGLCTKCNDNYYPMENDTLNSGEYFNCYNETPHGYYLDTENSIFKKCYYTCETCEIKGDGEFHNCLKCSTEFIFLIKINNFFNCYKNCSYNYYFDKNNNYYHCTTNLSCPQEYPKLIQNKNECVFEDIKVIENFIDNILNYDTNETNIEMIKEEEINKYNKILEKIESIFTSDNYDLTNIDKGEDQVISANRMLITFTNAENQKNNINSNMSTIDLGDCEILLRKHYNLTNNETIYLKKIDIIQDGTKAKKVEYNVYSKLSGKNLEKLNLTICEKAKISINIPIELNGNIDKYNTSSGYFNDICYTITSDDGTDISLKDRKKEYIEGDNIICQDDCEFSAYDSQTKKAKCECFAKESNLSFADMTINKMKLFDNLKDIRNLMNLKILICYKKLLLSFSEIINNIGCIIIIGIIVFHLISVFVFYLIQLNKTKKIIKSITFKIKNIKIMKKVNKKIKIANKKEKHNKIVKSNSVMNSKLIMNKKSGAILYNNNHNLNNIIMKYNNNELNDLPYYSALVYDKRTFCQFYFSLLKEKHNIIFTFCNKDDYNPGIIKIDLFFVGLTMDYAVNALFFNDETMHKIYEDKGLFDFATQIPITIYSFLISTILNIPLSILGLSNDKITDFKQNQTNQGNKKQRIKLIFCLKIKFAFYFIISFIFLLFFWYYITMFGVIYKNTQYHLLKDTLISFGLSLLYPFITCLLPGFFRIPSLSNPKKKRKCLYNFSKIFQLL